MSTTGSQPVKPTVTVLDYGAGNVRSAVRALETAGADVVLTREPGGTAIGERIRELLLHGDHVAPRAEALLFAADRAHHVETLVRPALEREMEAGRFPGGVVAIVLANIVAIFLMRMIGKNLDA